MYDFTVYGSCALQCQLFGNAWFAHDNLSCKVSNRSIAFWDRLGKQFQPSFHI